MYVELVFFVYFYLGFINFIVISIFIMGVVLLFLNVVFYRNFVKDKGFKIKI